PQDMVVRIAVRLNHAFPNREVEPLVVVTAVIVVDTAHVEYRNRCEASVAAELQSALLCACDCSEVACGSVWNIVGILIVTADKFVQVEKLRGRDLSGIQRRKA